MSRPERHEAFFRGMLGDVDEPTLPFGLEDVHGDGGRISRKRVSKWSRHRARRCGRARALGVSAASVAIWRGRRCWPG